MADVYIGLGSNLNHPIQQIQTALQSLKELPKTSLEATSSLFASKPQGPDDQPDFVNAVARIDTQLSPQQLLEQLQQLEKQQGKIKVRHWGERVIDLDILLYDQLQLASTTLTIPHPQMHLRDFVLLPLQQLGEDIQIPGQPALNKLINQLDERFVFPLNEIEPRNRK